MKNMFRNFNGHCMMIQRRVDWPEGQHTLEVLPPDEDGGDAVAVHYYKINHDLSTESIITIFPENVIAASEGWTKDEILLGVAITACHEMAHAIWFMRFVHDHKRVWDQGVVDVTLEDLYDHCYDVLRSDTEGGHHASWRKIMRTEMGASDDTSWCYSNQIPKILSRYY
jgi:hypothetical protein